jgi:hypothetical protein
MTMEKRAQEMNEMVSDVADKQQLRNQMDEERQMNQFKKYVEKQQEVKKR